MKILKYAREFAGEFIGTFLLVLFGCGSVAVSILFNAHQGLFQIGIVWGIGVTLAIYAAQRFSCAHLNPAVSFAMVTSGRMRIKKLPVYLSGQFFGAFAAGLLLFLLFEPSISAYEKTHQILRGSAESVQVAKMFGEYYGQPAGSAVVSMPLAILAEAFGTFLLVFMIFSLTENCKVGRLDNSMTPVFVGLTVTSAICLLAPLSQAGFNPARDFGPRMVAWMFGWGDAAFPDHSGGFFFVYILSPIIGGQAAALLFSRALEPIIKNSCDQADSKRDFC